MRLLREPSLGLLLRLKMRGSARRMWRRVKSPRGAALTLFGLALLGFWILAILLGSRVETPAGLEVDPESLRGNVRLALMIFFTVSVGGALVNRGLFLPSSEIERLFSSPLKRSDLVRYRLLVSVGRNLLGGALFAFLIARRLPDPIWGYFGVLVTIQVLPLANQFLAILAGLVEGRLARTLGYLGRGLAVLFALFAMVVVFLLVSHQRLDELPGVAALIERLKPHLAASAGEGGLALPSVLTRATLVFEPWARLLTATNPFDFATWLGVCLGLWVLLFEATARLPVDFRELSLDTAANIAARLRRMRRGGGAASAKASQGAKWLRVPWLIGRGPTRAVVWRKTTTVLRKARGTLWISGIVLVLVTLLSSFVTRGEELTRTEYDIETGRVVEVLGTGGFEELLLTLLPSLLIAGLGVLYLSGGLRFDFREDLDRMESMRSWPIPPARLFMATVLPQVLLVSVLVLGALALRVALTREYHPALLGLAAFVPPLSLAWIALDNAAFLFMPVRMTPGQGGMIPNAGRAFLVIFLRLGMLFCVAVVGAAAGMGTYFVADRFWGVSGDEVMLAVVASTWGALVIADVALLYVGGWLVSRFDVARDIP